MKAGRQRAQRHPVITLVRACAAAALLCGSPAAPAQTTAAPDIRVVAGPGHAAESLDRDHLRLMFTMRTRQWPDGQQVRLFVLPDSDPIHERFVREALGTFPYVLRNTWDRAVYTGTGLAPTVVRSEAEMLQRVRATPGAIGYVTRAALPRGKP